MNFSKQMDEMMEGLYGCLGYPLICRNDKDARRVAVLDIAYYQFVLSELDTVLHNRLRGAADYWVKHKENYALIIRDGDTLVRQAFYFASQEENVQNFLSYSQDASSLKVAFETDSEEVFSICDMGDVSLLAEARKVQDFMLGFNSDFDFINYVATLEKTLIFEVFLKLSAASFYELGLTEVVDEELAWEYACYIVQSSWQGARGKFWAASDKDIVKGFKAYVSSLPREQLISGVPSWPDPADSL